MYYKLLENYINNKFSKEDIIKFCAYENVKLSDNELSIFYSFIKKYWSYLLNGKEDTFFKLLKDKVSLDTYNTTIILYKKYIVYKKKFF